MRTFLLTTAMLAMPGPALAQSQCAVTKAAEPFIKLPPPINVTGAAVPLAPRPSARQHDQVTASALSQKPSSVLEQAHTTAPAPIPTELGAIPVLRHILAAGATLTELGTSHGMRSVAARHNGEFMVFQVAPDGQVAVAGLMTDVTVDQLRAISGNVLTELDAQHGLRSFFLRSGGRFQVFYATPDGARVIPGVMWDSEGQDLTRKAIAGLPGVTPTVTIGRDAADARVTPAIATSTPGATAEGLAEAAYGTSGNAAAPEIWAFIDPQCSYSIRAMQELQPFVDAGKVRLHLIPLSILDSEDNGLSTQHALGLLSSAPDQMLATWETGRYPLAPSDDATAKLATNMSAAAASQVSGTPTFFWHKSDGSEGRMDGVPNDMGALVAALGRQG